MQDLASVTVAILAGGMGTRLHPVMSTRPKVLAEIRGRPFLSYLLDQLSAVDVRYVVLCTGYMGEQVQAKFGDSYGSLRIAYSQEPSPQGTAGALRSALPLLKPRLSFGPKHSKAKVNVLDSVLVMNGDSFCEANLRAFWAWHCERDVDATLLLAKVPDTKRYGRVHMDTNGLLLRFDEKDDKHVLEQNEGSDPGWINAGIYLLRHRLLLTIPTGRAVSLEQEVFPAWVDRGLYGYRSKGRFLDIGTPEAYATAEQFFSED